MPRSGITATGLSRALFWKEGCPLISYLLSIGPAAEKTLPTILTALACGAASPIEHLNILHLSARPLDPASQESLSSLSGDLSSCHRLFSSPGEPALFPCDFSFSSCVPSLPVLQDFTKDEKTSLFLSALRGKGQPLSFLTDREAAEWAFSILLSSLPDSADDSLAPLCAWLENVRADLAQGDPVRLTLLADLSDPFAAGVALSLLYHLRRLFPDQPLFLTLLALAETSSPLPASFRDHLRSSLRSLEDRSLLRSSEEEKPLGADAMWLLSLPSSMVESPDSHQVTALCAARVLSAIHAGDQPPPMGFHSRETDGTLSLFSLRENAKPFAAFACAAVWLLSDLLPSLRNYLAHPARLRSIAPNSRSGLFRRLFSGADASSLSDNLSLLDRTLRSLLSRVLFFLRSVPSSLRFSADTVSLWQQGVEACGRYITVAAELDVSAAEAHESGLDAVRPVHRDSLADTEEEQLIRRLQDMRKQLESEEKSRAAVLETMGGFRSLQVRLDCLDQCRSALVDAREKLALSPEEDLDHLTLARRERRVRLLEAAVARCEKELDPASVQSALSALPKTAALSDPWQSAILPSEVCHALEDLLSRSGAESVSIPPLFPEEAMTDAKVWIKSLLALCRDQAPSRPLPFLLSRVLEICREAVSVCRFLSRSSMPSVPLLPDLIPLSPLLSVKSCLALLPEEENAPLRAREDLRGLLALLMLRPYRRRASGEAEVTVDSCVPSDSPVLRFWLSSRGAEKVWILSLSRDQESRPFALVLPGRAVLPARRSPAHAALVPAFASWFDPESLAFRDPCDFLGESDLLLLRELLAGYISALPEDASPELRSFLADFLRDLSREPEPLPADSRLKTRLLSACAFRSLSAYADSVRRVSTFYERFLSVDPLGACLSGRGDYPASSCTDLKEEILYLWQEIPFAR